MSVLSTNRFLARGLLGLALAAGPGAPAPAAAPRPAICR